MTVSEPDRSGSPGLVQQPEPIGRDDLVVRHLSLARSIARRFANRGETLDDLNQVAMLALVKAADRFDAMRGTTFSTFAVATISGELKRHFRDKRWAMRVTRSAEERYLLVRQAVEWVTEDAGRSPTIADIATYAGLSEEHVLEALEVTHAMHLGSLDGLERSEGDGAGWQPGGIDPAFSAMEWRVTFDTICDALAPRDQELIRMRFVEEMSQTEIAKALGISQMQVCRLLRRNLSAIRKSLSERAET